MNKEDLLKLLSEQHLTPAQLRERNPELWEKIEAELRESTRKRALDAIDPKDEATRKRIQGLDLKKPARLADLSKQIREAVQGTAAEGVVKDVPVAGSVLDVVDKVTKIDDKLPLKNNPEIDRLIRSARLVQIGKIGKLDSKLIDKIAA